MLQQRLHTSIVPAFFAALGWSSFGALGWVSLAALGCGQTAAPASEVESTAPVSETPAPAAPAPAGKRAPCTLGADQTCNADESVSALWGHCTELGVCECAEGFELNPGGRCQPPAH